MKNKTEAMAYLEISEAGVIDARVIEMLNIRKVSHAIDDRIGAFVVLELLCRYAAKPSAAQPRAHQRPLEWSPSRLIA
ncbi:hypothetical protein [Gemmatimonas sp.]|uniref:hypothetical protein n=1 Tax=Gemmatimonas sp. TaxID=1962908 RepID=UPI00286DB2C5|nr:hypothetical protein [Gemmatimonas sp.]